MFFICDVYGIYLIDEGVFVVLVVECMEVVIFDVFCVSDLMVNVLLGEVWVVVIEGFGMFWLVLCLVEF